MFGLPWAVVLLLIVLVGGCYLLIQAVITVRLYLQLRRLPPDKLHTDCLFARGFPTDLYFWDWLIVRYKLSVIAFDYDGVLAPRGSSVLYPVVPEVFRHLRDQMIGVLVTTNSDLPSVDLAFGEINTHHWQVQVHRSPQPVRSSWRRFTPRALLRYMCKKPWLTYWRSAFAHIHRMQPSPTGIMVVDDKFENLAGPLALMAAGLCIHPMPGSDTTDDAIWQLRRREQVLLRFIRVHRRWKTAVLHPYN